MIKRHDIVDEALSVILLAKETSTCVWEHENERIALSAKDVKTGDIQKALEECSAVCFFKDETETGDKYAFYYGSHPHQFCYFFQHLGVCWRK